ncbi:hypothetical protein K4F85_00260 [Phaeobacter inhibens]|uniref:hypothetical protein n=2 Tax=Phaeobacter inhibens TaxID=221822 RepID=UPI0021A3CC1F|nr:hypothetical protein [Phaeobacter inhibens]UWR41374.1 hypothetical protein K4F85_00260 [Phaeobacter inhibens]
MASFWPIYSHNNNKKNRNNWENTSGKNRAKVKPNFPRGKVSGSGDEKTYFALRPRRDACTNGECTNHGRSAAEHPKLYRKSGWTAKGAQRWKCNACLASFSVGSRIRRQKPGSANNAVLWMIINGTPISKICDFTGLSARDVYTKIDFIHDRVIDITARREGLFEQVDWTKVGRRFATDSQTLQLNWPNKKTRAQIAVHHLCTAHANTGYIMAAHVGLDPVMELPDIEA